MAESRLVSMWGGDRAIVDYDSQVADIQRGGNLRRQEAIDGMRRYHARLRTRFINASKTVGVMIKDTSSALANTNLEELKRTFGACYVEIYSQIADVEKILLAYKRGTLVLFHDHQRQLADVVLKYKGTVMDLVSHIKKKTDMAQTKQFVEVLSHLDGVEKTIHYGSAGDCNGNANGNANGNGNTGSDGGDDEKAPHPSEQPTMQPTTQPQTPPTSPPPTRQPTFSATIEASFGTTQLPTTSTSPTTSHSGRAQILNLSAPKSSTRPRAFTFPLSGLSGRIWAQATYQGELPPPFWSSDEDSQAASTGSVRSSRSSPVGDQTSVAIENALRLVDAAKYELACALDDARTSE